jgi:FtsP/CotA-like multicopper oxidase with cupredoxin domain
VLCVTQGQTVSINLTNTALPEATSIVFPGQTGVRTIGGSPGLFTSEIGPGPGTVTYRFVASQPGTYLYESGTNPHKQVHMGLYGVLIVRPSVAADRAYADPDTVFDTTQEYLLVIHDIDPDLHQAVERGEPYDITAKHDRYWTINGRSFPDTILPNNDPVLPEQPYGALVTVDEVPCATPGAGAGCTPAGGVANLPALIRYANAGLANHPFHPHGNHLRVIARDGRLLAGGGGTGVPAVAAMEAFTKTIGSGQTYDLLVRWVNEQEFDPTLNSVPVTVPSLQNLVFKDDVTFYSGSPYLGFQDDLPPTTTTFNACGELYYPWHSHALNEFQNFDEGFGGLATLFRVEPTGGCP